ncbi:hypothetical protein DERP_013483 [Dermatophagoides pteronyssinus]|uniref:Uncharacterized protein n=1 Tax=Dermatophagoides pteronyssinus TaxID=6956 RepID=A0ABQ8JSL8_DERPT|nr:hypothetical protein DERP_013483 [Dermatophagoides pteronyssinus]
MNKKVIIDWDTVHVEDLNPLKQCYKCLGFNHLSQVCPSTISLCSHCGGKHEFSECTKRNLPPVCLNCIKDKQPKTDPHGALNSKCPVYQQIRFMQLNTNHSPTAYNDLLMIATNKKIDILIISEPPLYRGIPIHTNKVQTFFSTKSSPSSSTHQHPSHTISPNSPQQQTANIPPAPSSNHPFVYVLP